MASPIYFFTRSGCVWCQKMKPSIDQINETLNDEQKIQIHSIDEQQSKVIYDRIKKIGGDGGLIAIDNKGNIAKPFNTDGMYRASWSKDGTPLVAIY